MSFPVVSIPLEQLLLDTSNPRFEAKQSQPEAIQAMVDDQNIRNGTNKLVNLGKDILENSLDPSAPWLVGKHEEYDDQYVVYEGNRRLTALKLLSSPTLIDGLRTENRTKNALLSLAKEFAKKPVTDVNCIVFGNRKDAVKWILLKHGGEQDGIGIVTWNSDQKARFAVTMGFSASKRSQQAIDLLLEHGLDSETASQVPTTNLDRLLDDPDARYLAGFARKDGGWLTPIVELEKAVRSLRRFVDDLTGNNPDGTKIKVGDVYTKADRKQYLDSLNPEDLPNLGKPESESNNSKPGSRGKNSRQKKMPGSSKSRKTLIPRGYVLNINNQRILNIFYELRKLPIDQYPNAVAVLFRVFLETSIDSYLKSNVINVHQDANLATKLDAIAKHLSKAGLLSNDQLKPINMAKSSPHSLVAINTFNAYVHNGNVHPSANELRTAWDNFAPFIQQLWK